jgi:succinate dehydrogenase / fumarate reductase flavoprotein subunit
VSVHGANRLGGNSLLETVVFGRRAGRRIRQTLESAAPDPLRSPAAFDERWRASFDSLAGLEVGARRAHELRTALTQLMTNNVSVFRVGLELHEAVEGIERIFDEYSRLVCLRRRVCSTTGLMLSWALGFLLDASRMIALAALNRTESRGAHFRADSPSRNNANWLKYVRNEDGCGSDH